MNTEKIDKNILIIGASRGIGLGFVKILIEREERVNIYATYRQKETAQELFKLQIQYSHSLTLLQLDIIEEEQISNLAKQLKQEISELHLVINCVGILHEDNINPEKSLRHINTENLLTYFQVNSIASVLLAKHLLPFFRHSHQSIFAAISAKVGSIEDNYLGGWYGYRASKAALNMFLKTISIEYKRTCPHTIVVALHPGTTDTNLSKPFQKNVPLEKLFSVERTVKQLLTIIDNLTENDTGQFFSWDGNCLPW
ncbi:putative short-chain dehydrogenase/reductase (SDR) superfamily [Crocosphaera subtropica ATCC 51142]|uniref:Short-chain dehydrogenase/reductase (SDR) superfamily n=1 Tax=Crocosphaera subtropica (strain ATCC 51142 / BH68) TaxID=43989 RepID=B1WVN0_CROS5|nr:SDR family NAD(P)-dependent oxidoreductase [Crocosphaera subtropica]ACB50617.1 putative short-chain dehydrogenase/reductase (SDR) superfamily [Crocosphaera subtropica ATCC 51142]